MPWRDVMLGAALLGALGVYPPRALALEAPIRTRLEWMHRRAVLDATAVAERLAAARGGADDLHALGAVRGVIVAEEQGFVLTLELFDAGQRKSRRITARECEDLGMPLWRRLGAFVRADVAIPLVRRPYLVNEVEGVHRPACGCLGSRQAWAGRSNRK